MDSSTLADSSMDSGSDTTGAGGALLSTLVPLLFRIATMVLGLAVVAGGALYVKQDKLLYFPEIGGIPRRPADNPRGYRSPAERQLPFESHRIPTADGVHIHAWLILAAHADTTTQAKRAPTILFFHGNAGNIGLRLPNAVQMLQYLRANILMVEYRGYGNSDNAVINEAGLKLDAEAALQFALQQHDTIDPTQIFLFGRSLGGSVAFHLAGYAVQQGIPLAGVMVENTFTSVSAMVDKLMPFLTPLKPFVLKIGWDSARIVPQLKSVPLLFLAGARDELVPHEQMMQLVALAEANRSHSSPSDADAAVVQLHIIPDGTHNESWMQGGPAYWDAMRDFMAAATRGRTSLSSQQQTTTTTTTTATNGSSNSSQEQKSSIPIMSNNFMGIAKEAVGYLPPQQQPNSSKDAKKEL